MGRFNTVKMTILKILSISLQVFEDINKFILKCICKNKGTEIVKTILEKKNKVEGIRLQSSKLIISNTKKLCAVGGSINTETKETKERTTKWTYTNMPKWVLTKMQKQFNQGKVALSTNGAGAIGYPIDKW